MRVLAGSIAVAVLLLSGAGVALADASNSGPITENSHHHEFTNCGASGALNVANCVDLLDL
jgi:hypothetical protein